MPASSVPPKAPTVLPPPLVAYVEATNSFDLEGLIATFADNALVNDQLRDYWGKPAIREWAARDIVGQSLTMNVTNSIEHYGNLAEISSLPQTLLGYQIRSYTPFTLRLTATGSFS
jgi:hypothetical protein